jgi:hypothetical protein
MANGLFTGMLGFNPVDLQQKRMQQFLAPVQQAQNPYERIGAALGTIGGGALFGIEDPQLQRASKIRSIMDSSMQNADLSDPTAYRQSLLTLAQNLKDSGEGDAAMYAMNEAAKIKPEGGRISLSATDIRNIAPEDRPRAIQAYQTTGELPPDISFVDKPEKFRDILKNIKDNPEQAQFLLQELSQKIEANPQDAEALQQYEQVARAASEGSIAKFAAEQKDKLSIELDTTRLIKYKQDLADTEKLSPAARWNAEIDAARDLLKVYGIDRTKPLAGQVTGSLLYSPVASEITNAYRKAGTKKTNEGGKVTEKSTAANSPKVIDFNSLPKSK